MHVCVRTHAHERMDKHTHTHREYTSRRKMRVLPRSRFGWCACTVNAVVLLLYQHLDTTKSILPRVCVSYVYRVYESEHPESPLIRKAHTNEDFDSDPPAITESPKIRLAPAIKRNKHRKSEWI